MPAASTNTFFVLQGRLRISDDVAGATLMAAGGCAPELFANAVATLVLKSSVGVGTVTGSLVRGGGPDTPEDPKKGGLSQLQSSLLLKWRTRLSQQQQQQQTEQLLFYRKQAFFTFPLRTQLAIRRFTLHAYTSSCVCLCVTPLQ
jgi:hypothetical protein